jgi:gas vesicle protein
MNRDSAMSNSSDWLIRSVKQNPEGLLLLAAGVALLMRTASSPSAPAWGRSDTMNDINRAAGRATDQMSGMASDMANQASGMASQARDKVAEFASAASNRVSDFASSASDRAARTAQTVNEQTARMARQTSAKAQDLGSRVLSEQPLVVAVAGLAAGAALAAAFPATQLEKQTLGPIGDQVGDAAQRVGDQLKQATAAAGETLKNAAQERGLNKEGLKDVAQEAANAFSDRMSGKPDSESSTGAKPQSAATTDPRF